MSAGSASCAQDWSLVLRPWSCPSSPCQMTSWPTSHGSCLTQRQPVGLHKPAVQVISSCANQSVARATRGTSGISSGSCSGQGYKAKGMVRSRTLCTTALKHQRTVSTTAALLATSRGHAMWHHTAYSRCRQSQQTVESPTALPPKRIRSFDDYF